MTDNHEQTDEYYARLEIEAAREAYWIDQMREAYETGVLIGRSTKLCDEIDHEMKARGFKPTRSCKRIDELMKLCPF